MPLQEHRYTLTRINACPDFRLKPEKIQNCHVYECIAVVPENCLVVGVNVGGFCIDVYMWVLSPIPSLGPGHRFLVRRIVSPVRFNDAEFPGPGRCHGIGEDFLNGVIGIAMELGEAEAGDHRRENPKPIYRPRGGRIG